MDAVRDRYPEHFRRTGAQRLPVIAIATAMFALLLFGMERLGFFDGKLLSGMGRLVEIAGLMLPPDPGSWAHARAYGMALIETVAIALLGTLSAAILALPVGLLAARNVTARRIVRFLARRSLDTIRSVDILIWALIWINVVGLGPFAGALAIMTSDDTHARTAKLVAKHGLRRVALLKQAKVPALADAQPVAYGGALVMAPSSAVAKTTVSSPLGCAARRAAPSRTSSAPLASTATLIMMERRGSRAKVSTARRIRCSLLRCAMRAARREG